MLFSFSCNENIKGVCKPLNNFCKTWPNLSLFYLYGKLFHSIDTLCVAKTTCHITVENRHQ